MFTDDTPTLEKLKDGWWDLADPVVYKTHAGQTITVPVGFKTNLASVPQIFWNIIPRDGNYTPAAIVHDWLYSAHAIEGKPITRADADRVLLEAMEDLQINWLTRRTIWAAVRLGGWACWPNT